MNWFERLTGFREESPEQVRSHLSVAGNTLRSHVNGRQWICGELETPSLAELGERARTAGPGSGRLSLREVVADVRELHMDPSNAGALFQVASQFNLLEMVSPEVTPEDGVGIYENDPTQGPACAIAAGAGTIYRNYFVVVNGRVGQTADNQIDCLADVGEALGNEGSRLWRMQNGYALASREGLIEISRCLRMASEKEIDNIRGRLRIGIQRNTQVTLGDCKHLVSQAYCSALPIAYCSHPPELWTEFARLVLEAAYESTLCAAMLNAEDGGTNRVFLTLLGGGAFGNPTEWIVSAMRRALLLHQDADLEVVVVSHGWPKPEVRDLVAEWSR